jgi:glycosyltransferase involved in cell wall biosynthesis
MPAWPQRWREQPTAIANMSSISKHKNSVTNLDEEPQRRLRIAWIGTPTPGGGVGGFGRQLIEGLAEVPHEIVVFALGDSKIEERLGWANKRVEFVYAPIDWDWGRWYSRSDIAVFISSFWSRMRGYNKLIGMLEEAHREQPFDVAIQFSQTELFSTRKRLSHLPPLILFPCVHAAGELYFHNKEKRLSSRCESRFKYWLVNLNLRQRSFLQKRAYSAVYGVIGMSRRFNEWVRKDYGIASENQAVVYQPIPEGMNFPSVHDCVVVPSDSTKARVRILYVGRISVRKGIEMVVDLSNRLQDLHNQVELVVIGTSSYWSNYTKILNELNKGTAKYIGHMSHESTLQEMGRADFILVPSHYEPGGIVVAEAMRMGCAVLASDEVGSAENLPESVCRRFPAGNIDEFERVVRDAVMKKLCGEATGRSEVIRQSNQWFSLDRSIDKLTAICRRAADRKPICESISHS